MATPVLKNECGDTQHVGVRRPHLGQDRGEVGGPQGVGVDENHLEPLLLGQPDAAL